MTVNKPVYITCRQLHSLRPPLPDVPAVYFVSPTLANVRRIAEDLEKNLYESFYLNFVEPLPRALLEELSASVARDGTGELVEQVRPSSFLHARYSWNILGYRPIFIFYRPLTFSFFPTTPSTAVNN
jgi:hypothetical protein